MNCKPVFYKGTPFCPNKACENTGCKRRFDKGEYDDYKSRGGNLPVVWLSKKPKDCPLRPDRGAAVRTGRRRKNKALCRAIAGKNF